MPAFGPPLATCILLFTVIYGYVMLVASSFPMAPRKKMSPGMILRRFSSPFFSCSKIVYCNIGLITKTSAGNTPAKRALGPSSLKSLAKVAIFDVDCAGLSNDVEDVGRSTEEDSD